MPVTATEAPPEIDNLYLDMNGIIHNCTHANDPTLRLTETEMVLKIFMYLDKLIHITKPKKLVLLAIDGACLSAQYQHISSTGWARLAHSPHKHTAWVKGHSALGVHWDLARRGGGLIGETDYRYYVYGMPPAQRLLAVGFGGCG